MKEGGNWESANASVVVFDRISAAHGEQIMKYRLESPDETRISRKGLNPSRVCSILRDPERTGTQSRRRFSLDLGTRNVAAEAGKEKRKERALPFHYADGKQQHF